MLEYSRWKYTIFAIVLIFSVIYALPNLFPPDPAVQIRANAKGTVDAALQDRVKAVLAEQKITGSRLAIEDKDLVVRLNDAELQTRAADSIRSALGTDYTTALNLASTVPSWMKSIGARPMKLGLDLQGGVHFLMQVDQNAAREKRENAWVGDIEDLMRTNNIAFNEVKRLPDGIHLRLAPENKDKAARIVRANLVDLQVEDAPDGLVARITPQVLSAIADQAIEQNLTILRNRVNALGVAEPVIQRQGRDRIVVQLPGVQDPAEAEALLGATATLEYRAVIGEMNGDQMMRAQEAERTGNVPGDARIYYMRQLDPSTPKQPILLSKRVLFSGDQMVNAVASTDQNGLPAVLITLNDAGGDNLFKHTSKNVGKGMAAVYIESNPVIKEVNGERVITYTETQEVINAATIQDVLSKNFQTTGLESEEAQRLAKLLKAGALAAPSTIIERRVIGPSLGKENIEAGWKAVGFSFLFVLVFFVIYYKMFGIISNLALLLNLLLLVAVMSALIPTTLTLPGLAGIALTVGMSVDANVLINERIREELRAGNSPLASIAQGFDKASGTIWDANITAALAGVAMIAFGSGPLKGFGISMVVGILTSMYTAVSVARGIATLIYGRRKKLTGLAI
jgi:preprotein translocase subunit SecD